LDLKATEEKVRVYAEAGFWPPSKRRVIDKLSSLSKCTPPRVPSLPGETKSESRKSETASWLACQSKGPKSGENPKLVVNPKSNI
jgi:hypothetical protein